MGVVLSYEWSIFNPYLEFFIPSFCYNDLNKQICPFISPERAPMPSKISKHMNRCYSYIILNSLIFYYVISPKFDLFVEIKYILFKTEMVNLLRVSVGTARGCWTASEGPLPSQSCSHNSRQLAVRSKHCSHFSGLSKPRCLPVGVWKSCWSMLRLSHHGYSWILRTVFMASNNVERPVFKNFEEVSHCLMLIYFYLK